MKNVVYNIPIIYVYMAPNGPERTEEAHNQPALELCHFFPIRHLPVGTEN